MERLKIIGEVVLGEQGFFTVGKIARETGIPAPDVRVVLDRLFRAGLLLRVKIDPQFATLRGRPPAKLLYQKRNKRDFARKIAPKLKENTALDRAWSVIRNKSRLEGSFTVKDVVALGKVGRENARWFVKKLRKAGIIARRGHREWILIKDPGPKRPYVSKKNQDSKFKIQDSKKI